MGEPTKEKAWEPSFEEAVLATWKGEPDLYRFAPAGGRSVFVIDTPPPYPSGSWHIGAVMAYSMIDIIARGQRMLGRAVLFPFGLDRNGINIERTVERKIRKPLHGGTGQAANYRSGIALGGETGRERASETRFNPIPTMR